ncbi:hypothetical protein SAMN05421788_106179 [Filimonas lacunae]|uniref:YD repeat-containing protein n=1 Tax=Filimonas lacunae TaxID=477680 RepID=A0A173MFB0_9BACT|nr:hypothetical protein [Filimonas lacunae]BAV06118.1 hypothetical protein FLA_2133 [Filimonas lacunae]SIT24733.1 hypothetical protein SAMN05421788_106179 [Filimonas lacunae]
MKRFFVPVLMLAIATTSCSKNDSTPETGTSVNKLYRVVNSGPTGAYAHTYNYGANKMVIKDSTETGTWADSVVFTNNRPSALIGADKNYTFEYNANGQVLKAVLFEDRYDSLVYNQDGTVATVFEFQYGTVRESRQFTWANGNITQMIRLYNGNTPQTIYKYSYDDKINPYYNVASSLLWYYIDDFYFGSKNNITKITLSDANTPNEIYEVNTYTYTYNSDNQPATCIFKNGDTEAEMNVLENLVYQYKTSTN